MHSFITFGAIALALSRLSFAANITVYQPNEPFAPQTLPPPNPASKSDQIVQIFSTLGRTTVWNLVQKTPFQYDTGEPEGMVRLGTDRYFVSAGTYSTPTVSYGNNTIINGTDRTDGAGFAHLIVFDSNGTRIADATLTAPGALEYHNGGIDYDGEFIWAAIAQYRPNTTAYFLKIDPRTLEYTTVFHANDHFGGIVHDTQKNEIVTLNWGSRNSSIWKLDPSINSSSFPAPQKVNRNPSFYVDYQDCKFLGHPEAYNYRGVMMCSGVTALTNNCTIGGLAIVDEETMIPLDEIPLTMVSDLGTAITQNPMDVDIVDGKLRAYFLPDQHNSTLYVYEAQPQSPYEF